MENLEVSIQMLLLAVVRRWWTYLIQHSETRWNLQKLLTIVECGLGFPCNTMDAFVKANSGNWKGAAVHRFIPSGGSLRYYRHQISSRYAVWKMYGSDAMIFLHGEAKEWSEISEQLLSASPIVTSSSVVKAINELYYDPSNSKGFKKGAGGKDGGTARRFVVAFWQLYETYDLRTMDSETILSLLPDEFDRFQPETVGDDE